MADKTKIEWTDASWNPVTGCSPVSAACDHCYAKRMWDRFSAKWSEQYDDHENPGFNQIRFWPNRLDQPLRWKKPRRVFVCSMSDLFHVDVEAEWRNDVFRVMEACRRHTFMVLTKRSKPMRQFVNAAVEHCGRHPGENIWFGVSAENSRMMFERTDDLMQMWAAKRFISFEPLLERVSIASWTAKTYPSGRPLLDWVICGGETGPGARLMHPDWARLLRDQCVSAGVPFFFKGHGTAAFKKSHPHYMLLDGRQWAEFPEVKE